MKNQNLLQLLTLKSQNVKHVVQNDKGVITPMENGATGTVKGVDESVFFELVGETTLSEANVNLLKQLKRLKLPSTPKAKEKPKA